MLDLGCFCALLEAICGVRVPIAFRRAADTDYKALQLKYFGGDGEGASTLSWKPDSAFVKEEAATAKGLPPDVSYAAAPSSAAPSEPSEGTASPEGTAAPGTVGSSPASRTTKSPPDDKRPPPATLQWRTPRHSIIHRGVGDLASAWGDASLSVSQRPRELLVKVQPRAAVSVGDG